MIVAICIILYHLYQKCALNKWNEEWNIQSETRSRSWRFIGLMHGFMYHAHENLTIFLTRISQEKSVFLIFLLYLFILPITVQIDFLVFPQFATSFPKPFQNSNSLLSVFLLCLNWLKTGNRRKRTKCRWPFGYRLMQYQ